jgi:hypothetical protein
MPRTQPGCVEHPVNPVNPIYIYIEKKRKKDPDKKSTESDWYSLGNSGFLISCKKVRNLYGCYVLLPCSIRHDMI